MKGKGSSISLVPHVREKREDVREREDQNPNKIPTKIRQNPPRGGFWLEDIVRILAGGFLAWVVTIS